MQVIHHLWIDFIARLLSKMKQMIFKAVKYSVNQHQKQLHKQNLKTFENKLKFISIAMLDNVSD